MSVSVVTNYNLVVDLFWKVQIPQHQQQQWHSCNIKQFQLQLYRKKMRGNASEWEREREREREFLKLDILLLLEYSII